MTRDTCGPPWHKEFASYDPDSSCWRTSQGTFPWGSGEFSGTWPTSGMTRGGFAYELPTSAPHTAAPDCSSPQLLPTPVARDWKSESRAGSTPTRAGGPSLAEMVLSFEEE